MNSGKACQELIGSFITHFGGHGISHSGPGTVHNAGQNIVVGIIGNHFDAGGLWINLAHVTVIIGFEGAR